MARQSKSDFALDIRFTRRDGKMTAEVVSKGNQTDPTAVPALNNLLQETAAKLQKPIENAYDPDGAPRKGGAK